MIQLAPRLHMLPFPVGHVYLWAGPDGLTVVDSGVAGSAPAIAAAVESLGLRRDDVRRLLLTHFHDDHVGSAADIAAWGDVTVYAHRADAPAIRGEAPGPPPQLSDWERDLLAQVQATMPPGPPAPVRVDVELADGDAVDLGGGVHAVAVAVPGHTPGSVAFHLPEPKVLFTGDTVARGPDGTVMLGVFNSDPDLAAVSLELQARLAPATACFGHGGPAVGDAASALRSAAGLSR